MTKYKTLMEVRTAINRSSWAHLHNQLVNDRGRPTVVSPVPAPLTISPPIAFASSTGITMQLDELLPALIGEKGDRS